MALKMTVVVLALLLGGLAGCATAPVSVPFPYQTVSLNNRPYFPLVHLCEGDRVAWDYDPLSQVIVLKKDDKEWKLMIGSSKIMMGSSVIELSAPVEIRDSVIYAPPDLRDYIIPPPCKLPVPPPAVPGAVFLRPVNIIVLDPGHGGKDPGAIGRYGLREKDVVLDIAKRTKDVLERCGLTVALTRDKDEFIPLASRPRMADARKADLFISIHANANRSRRLDGFEAYYLGESVDDDARAVAAAENAALSLDNQGSIFSSFSLKALLWDLIYTENRKESIELAQRVCRTVSRKMDLKALGVKAAAFAVLKGAYVPSVLLEIGYISNGDGERRLRDPAYRQRMAEAIAEGIMNFKNYAEGRK